MKPIKEYEELYFISEEGEVFSKTRKNTLRLKPCRKPNGYLYVTLYKKGNHVKKSIHRLVMENFVPNPNNLPQVNHIDGNKTHNHITNLEWCNASENAKHSWNMGNRVFTEKAKESSRKNVKLALAKLKKFTNEDVAIIRELRDSYGIGCRRLQRMFSVSKSCIDNILNEKTYKLIEIKKA
jgi:hypothetical protein